MEISLAAETIGHIGSFPIYNSFLASLIISGFLIWVAFKVKRTTPDLNNRFYNLIEMIVEGFLTVVESMLGKGKLALKVMPVIGTFFVFIMLSNWFGFFPFVGSVGIWEPKHHVEASGEPAVGAEHVPPALSATESTHPDEVELKSTDKKPEAPEMILVPLLRAPYSDLNMTLAMALISVILIQYFGFSTLGKGYAKKFLNFSNPILLFVGLLEIISEVVKIFSFAFRLFGNIFAGEVLLIVMFSLVPFVAPLPFLAIESFAGFIQALIFSMLSLVFINSATTAHH